MGGKRGIGTVAIVHKKKFKERQILRYHTNNGNVQKIKWRTVTFFRQVENCFWLGAGGGLLITKDFTVTMLTAHIFFLEKPALESQSFTPWWRVM